MEGMVVCFPTQGGKIFLGKRKNPNRPWFGMLSGFGGRIEKGEEPKEAQKRELFEETRVEVEMENILLAGKIILCLSGRFIPLFVYLIENWEGSFQETREMFPKTYSIKDVPYDQMVKGDELWLPFVLRGKYFEGFLERNGDWNKLERHYFICFHE